jgi:hypothetical protein
MARQPMPKALSSLQSVQRSYTSEFSVGDQEFELAGEWVGWYPRKEEENLQFGSNQVVLAKDVRRAVAVETVTAEL